MGKERPLDNKASGYRGQCEDTWAFSRGLIICLMIWHQWLSDGPTKDLAPLLGETACVLPNQGASSDAMNQRLYVLRSLQLVDFRSPSCMESPLLSFGNKCLLSFTCAHYYSARDRSGEGSGTPLQYSCLENSMDGGELWCQTLGILILFLQKMMWIKGGLTYETTTPWVTFTFKSPNYSYDVLILMNRLFHKFLDFLYF